MSEDLTIGTVASRRLFLNPIGFRRTGLGGVLLLASCGTGEQVDLFDPVDVGVRSSTPAARAATAAAAAPAATTGADGTAGPGSAPGGGTSAGPSVSSPTSTPATSAAPAPMAEPVAGPEPGSTPSEEAPDDGTATDPADDGAVDAAPGAPLACPIGASFCSGFEGADLPAGATYVSQRGAFVPGQSLVFDSDQRFSGEQSLLVPADTLIFDYRMLSVAIPGNDFWVRLYVRTDVVFGDDDVDTLFLASVLTEGFNGDSPMQLAEQFNQVVLNKNGALHAVRENPVITDPGTRLAADEWHCLEAFFGGTSGDVSVFLAGQPIITAVAWQPATYRTFRFGYERFTTERNVWVDDVAVAPERIGCE